MNAALSQALLTSLVLFGLQPVVSQERVVLCEHYAPENRGSWGKQKALSRDVRDFGREWGGEFHDFFQSVIVPEGWRITLYEHPDFHGIAEAYGPGIHKLERMFKQASSFRLTEAPPRPPRPDGSVPMLCEHFGPENKGDWGEQRELWSPIPEFRLQWGDPFTNYFRAIIVPEGWYVAIFDHEYFRGSSELLGPGEHRLRELFQRGSSAKAAQNVESVGHKEKVPTLCEHSAPEQGGAWGKQKTTPRTIPDFGREWGGDFNDFFEAIVVPTGWYVTIYEHPDFHGASNCYGPGEHNLGELRRLASSLRARRLHRMPRPNGPVPTLCERFGPDNGSDWGIQRPIWFTEFDVRGRWGGESNDFFTSVIVPRGWTLFVFEHEDYGGEYEKHVGPIATRLTKLAGRVTSVLAGRGNFDRPDRSHYPFDFTFVIPWFLDPPPDDLHSIGEFVDEDSFAEAGAAILMAAKKKIEDLNGGRDRRELTQAQRAFLERVNNSDRVELHLPENVLNDIRLVYEATLVREVTLLGQTIPIRFDTNSKAQTFDNMIFLETPCLPGNRPQLILLAHHSHHVLQVHQLGGFEEFARSYGRASFVNFTEHGNRGAPNHLEIGANTAQAHSSRSQ